MLAGSSSEELVDFIGAKFYCPHALAGGNQCIQIREMLEFSSTLSPYRQHHNKQNKIQRRTAYNRASVAQNHSFSLLLFSY